MNTSTTPGSSGSGGPSDPDDKRKLIENERIKITALLLNNFAMATLGSGVIVPSVTIAYGTWFPQSPYYFLVAAGWLTVGILTHLLTRWTLRGLKT